jgi:hypothetical protein
VLTFAKSTCSPSIALATVSTAPPTSMPTAENVTGFGGTGNLEPATVPVAQPAPATSTSHGPHHVAPCAPATGPPSSNTARPATPISTPSSVTGGGR